MPTPHIESKKEDIAKKVIMPGDPDRAEYIAKTFLEDARKVNSTRGESAFTGYYKGEMITVFSSGMGIASMGIYSHELYNDYDVEYIIRVGTAGSYSENYALSDIFMAESAYSTTSFDTEAINENVEIINASIEINAKIEDMSRRYNIPLKKGRVFTTEAFYGHGGINEDAISNNAFVVEMETYALFLTAKKFHKHAASIVTISDTFYDDKQLTREERVNKVDTMIKLALESLIKIKK